MIVSWESEKELEEFLLNKDSGRLLLEKLWLDTDGSTATDLQISNQVKMPGYGVADIVMYSEEKDCCIVIELKNDKLKSDHFAQAARYESFVYSHTNVSVCFSVVVTTSRANQGDSCFLANKEDVHWFSVGFDHDGGITLNDESSRRWVVMGESDSCHHDTFMEAFAESDGEENG